MLNKTPLYEQHVDARAKLVDFHGWSLPIHYGSQLSEHQAVREQAGVFDVSHMTVVDLQGEQVELFLQYLLANNVAKLKSSGRALYTTMLQDDGGILDDLIAYKVSETFYRLVLNAATRDKDLAWIERQRKNYSIDLTVRDDLSIVAVQGPKARELTLSALVPDLAEQAVGLKPFAFVLIGQWQVARTGYTGEDGFEVIMPATEVVAFWRSLLAAGATPCGLGARDTLRLEAGLNLYGADMDESVTPLESNIAWTVALEPKERNFIGRAALEQQQQSKHKLLLGLMLTERGVLRAGQQVLQQGEVIGEVVSGTFSPTLRKGIAFVRVRLPRSVDCQVEVRGKLLSAQIVTMPFVRQGKSVFKEWEVECHE